MQQKLLRWIVNTSISARHWNFTRRWIWTGNVSYTFFHTHLHGHTCLTRRLCHFEPFCLDLCTVVIYRNYVYSPCLLPGVSLILWGVFLWWNPTFKWRSVMFYCSMLQKANIIPSDKYYTVSLSIALDLWTAVYETTFCHNSNIFCDFCSFQILSKRWKISMAWNLRSNVCIHQWYKQLFFFKQFNIFVFSCL